MRAMLAGVVPRREDGDDDRPAPALSPVEAETEAPLRVGVNLLWCVPGRVGGSEQYLVRQLLGLRECRANVALTVYGSGAFEAAHDDVASLGRYVVAPVDGRRRWRRVLTEARWLRTRTRAARQRLVHHGGGTAPVGAPTPYVLTIHDLQYRTFPQYFSPVKRRYLDAMIPRSVRDAAVVTVPTEFVRRSVIEQMDVPPRQVVVVPHGYEPALLTNRTPEAELRRRYALGTAGSSSTRRSPTRTRTTACWSTSSPDRGRTRTSGWCCSVGAVRPRPTSPQRSPPPAHGPATGSCGPDVSATPIATGCSPPRTPSCSRATTRASARR